MAYVEPKTNWEAGNIPVASDLNRIEGNTKQNHDDVQPSSLLAAIKTVDGAGSGLDSDSVDGLHPFSTLSPNTVVSRDSNSKSYVAPIIASGDILSAGVEGELRLVVNGSPSYKSYIYIYVSVGPGFYEWKQLSFA